MRLSGVLAVGLLGAAAFAACSNREVHAFSAWAYDADRDCLERPSIVDVLDGPDTGPCSQLRCWVSAGGDVYVTDTACDAPPDFKNETSDETGLCPEALKVYGRDMHGECPMSGTGGSIP
ncbi:MAG TPA: hypothetical protein VHB21_00200 [Minicystis sp.]|nr:hypothetical protein [Minicystis sp.]